MKEQGFTLVEILVAMVILVVILSGVFAGISAFYSLEKRTEDRTVAEELAKSFIERSFIPDFKDLNFPRIETINGILYTVQASTMNIAADATAMLQKVTVNVIYTLPTDSTTRTVSISVLQIRMKR